MDILNTEKKEELKKRLLNKIALIEQKDLKLSTAVRNLAQTFDLDPVTKARLKEALLTRIETVDSSVSFWQSFFLFNKKFVSAFVLFVLSFGFVSILTVDVHVVRAESFTTLQDFVGDVSVSRGGMKLDVQAGMKLLEDDMVATGANGWISIEYFDDSVTRLASNTQIVLAELDEMKDLSSGVQIVVKKGQMWSKVVNLVDESYFTVKAEEVSAEAKKAAFNVDVKDDEVKVEVFSHVVKLNDGTELVSGNKAVVAKDQVKLEEISSTDKELGWVKNNIQSDQEYVVKIEGKIENGKRVGVKEGDFDNSIREDALLLITFDEIKKSKIELDLLEKKMIAAELTLSSETASEKDIEQAMNVVNNFSAEVKDFYGMVLDVEIKDSNYALQLKDFVDEKLARRQKDLSLVGPDEKLYEVRKIVDELALVDVKDDVERIELEYAKAREDLLDADEKLASGDYVKAQELVAAYDKSLSEITAKVDSLSEDQKTLITKEFKEQLFGSEEAQETEESAEIEINTTTSTVALPTVPKTSETSYGVKVLDDKLLPPEL